MTRKHFIEMARMIREARLSSTNKLEFAHANAMQEMAIKAGIMSNPRFNVSRFKAACEPDNA